MRQTRFDAGDGATHLLLVRHGESAALDAGDEWPTMSGHGNPPLHPHGHAQAERVADRLAGERLAAVYVTPFDRTRDTAAPLLRRLGMEAREEWELREFHFGEWESPMARRYFAEDHPMALRINAEERWDIPPGAEGHEAFGNRVTSAVRRIADRHRGEVVAVFSHGGVIGRVLAEAAGSRPFAFTVPDNASISHLVVSGARWTVRRFNDTGHLSDRFVDVPDLPWEAGVDVGAEDEEDAMTTVDVAALQDRLDVADTIYRYASTIDRRDMVGLRRVLDDHIVAQYGNAAPMTGGDTVAAWIDAATADAVWQHHLLSVYHTDIEGDRAEALVYHTSYQCFREDPESVRVLVARYHNGLTRTATGWLISRLLFEILWAERRTDPEALLARSGGRGPLEIPG